MLLTPRNCLWPMKRTMDIFQTCTIKKQMFWLILQLLSVGIILPYPQTINIHRRSQYTHQQKAMTMIIIYLVNRMSGGGEGGWAAVREREGFIFNKMSLLWQKTDVIHVLIYTYLHTYTCNWVWAYLDNVIKSIYDKCCYRTSERYCRNWEVQDGPLPSVQVSMQR